MCQPRDSFDVQILTNPWSTRSKSSQTTSRSHNECDTFSHVTNLFGVEHRHEIQTPSRKKRTLSTNYKREGLARVYKWQDSSQKAETDSVGDSAENVDRRNGFSKVALAAHLQPCTVSRILWLLSRSAQHLNIGIGECGMESIQETSRGIFE